MRDDYLWNFGDGTTSTLANPTHTYATAGEYDVTLIVTEANACIGSCTAYASTKQVYVGPKPVVAWDFQYNGNCLTYDFNSNSTVTMGWIAGFYWDFGNGTTSTQSNPLATFSTPGIYNVKLVVTTNYGCKDSLTIPVNIINKCNYTPCPIANNVIYSSGSSLCSPYTSNINASSLGDNITYLWQYYIPSLSSWGNGPNSGSQNYNVSGLTAGTYQYRRIALYNDGITTCRDSSATITLTVVNCPTPCVASPTITTNSYNVCNGDSILLKATKPTTGGSYYTYWYKDGVEIANHFDSIYVKVAGNYYATTQQYLGNGSACYSNASNYIYIGTNCGVTGGGGGGVESKTLGDVIAVRLYGNAVNSTTVTTAYTNSNKFVTTGVIVNGTQDLSLNALIPATVSNTDAAYTSTPTDLVNFTNAVEVLAVDYTKAGSTKAVAFGTKTLGDVYTHTKPICDRLKGAELQEVKNITVNGFNLMAYKLRQRTGETEYAINLSAGTAAARNSISLQSNWFTDSYQQDEKLYNFQLWAVSYDMVTAMATDIISKLQANGAVNTVTNADLPKAYISKGSRKGTDLTVTINNNTAATSGYFELHEKANENAATTTRQVAFTIQPLNSSTIQLPVKDNYEGDIYVYLNNKLTDLVYLADGTWSLDYNKNTTTISKFDVVNENNPTTNSNEHRLFRNVAVTGTSKDYITIYKTMMGGGLEQNVADYKSIMFNANAIGAGKVQVTLVKKSITNWNEQYTYTMDLDGNKEYGINLNQFKSTKFNDAIIANDITAVNFSFFTSRSVPTAMNINLNKARFSNAGVATNTNDASTMKVTPNPTTGRFTTTFVSTASESVTFNVTEIATGKTVFTKSIAANKGTNELVIDLNKQTQIAGGMYLVSIKSDTQVFKPAKLVVNKN